MASWQCMIASTLTFVLAATAGAAEVAPQAPVQLPPRPAQYLYIWFPEHPGSSRIPPEEVSCLWGPRPLKEVAFTDAKNRAWAERFAGQLKAAVKDIGVLLVGGRVSSSLSYGIFTLRGENMPYELAIVREKDGALIYRTKLAAELPDFGWFEPSRVGAFSYDISKAHELHGLVISMALGIPFRYGISAVGGLRVFVVSGNKVVSAKVLGETCSADISQDSGLLRSDRAYVVDADGDGYRDLLLWERIFDVRDPSERKKGEYRVSCSTFKSESAKVARFNPGSLDFQLQPAARDQYALRDDLWYPGGWGVLTQGVVAMPWAGCADSDFGWEFSQLFTYLCDEDAELFPVHKTFFDPGQTGEKAGKSGR